MLLLVFDQRQELAQDAQSFISIKLHLCVFMYVSPHNTIGMTQFLFVIYFTSSRFLGSIKLTVL